MEQKRTGLSYVFTLARGERGKLGVANVVGCSLLGLIADSLSGGVSDIASDYPK